jgi:hypothetical protein
MIRSSGSFPGASADGAELMKNATETSPLPLPSASSGDHRGRIRAWVIAGLLSTLPGAALAQQMFIYPSRGQSEERQQRDKYECNQWAVEQTGFDPSNPPPMQGYGEYQPPPPQMQPPRGGGLFGGLFGGAFRGATLGAVGGAIGGNAGEGAAIGAATGGLFGAMRRRERMAEFEQQQSAYQMQIASVQSRQRAAYASLHQAFSRAMKACLQGRGYTVE